MKYSGDDDDDNVHGDHNHLDYDDDDDHTRKNVKMDDQWTAGGRAPCYLDKPHHY